MTAIRIAACSVSRQVQEWLEEGALLARVLAVFERACDLVIGDGEVIALVGPEIGDGPLNVVLQGGAGLWGQVQPGAKVVCGAERLRFLGKNGTVSVQVDLEGTALWEPCPEWDRLRAQRCEMRPALGSLRALCLADGLSSVLLPLLCEATPVDETHPARASHPSGATHARPGVALERARGAAVALRAGWGEDGEPCGGRASLRRGAAALAGLGGGLTPAGDDFLVGLMLWAWLAHPDPRSFCQALAEEAAPRTTTLSAAFLRAAARGQCSAAWQRLLLALAEGREGDVLRAGRQVLGFGASSGADALVGFLYMVPGA